MAGYSLHIERETKIDESEWLEICVNDKSLEIQDEMEITNPNTGEVINIATPNSCLWTSPILRKKYLFTFSNGTVTFGTEKAQIKKAKKIAKTLRAKVIGDEGEEY